MNANLMSDPYATLSTYKRKENSMNLQEFQNKVQADRLAQAEALRKSNLEKSQDFLATLKKGK
jgi:hypothetical protein